MKRFGVMFGGSAQGERGVKSVCHLERLTFPHVHVAIAHAHTLLHTTESIYMTAHAPRPRQENNGDEKEEERR